MSSHCFTVSSNCLKNGKLFERSLLEGLTNSSERFTECARGWRGTTGTFCRDDEADWVNPKSLSKMCIKKSSNLGILGRIFDREYLEEYLMESFFPKSS